MEESWVEIVELFSRPSSPHSSSVLDAASTLLALRNALPTVPSSAASSGLTILILVINRTEEFSSIPVHPTPVPIQPGQPHALTVNRGSALIMTTISPFYNPVGYLMTHTLPTSTHLKNIAYVDRHTNCTGTIAWIMEVSQYDGVALWMPINSILEHGDVVLLLAVVPVPSCSPLITRFQLHSVMTFHLRVVIFLDYEDGHLHFFSEPPAPEVEPISETLSITLMTTVNYHFHITFLREDPAPDSWILRHLQLTLLSSPILIQNDCMIGHASLICLGPEDLWEQMPHQAKTPQYWLSASLLGNNAYFQWLMPLNIRVSQCLTWVFSMHTYTIRYLVAEVLS